MLFAHCCVEKSSVEVYCSLGLLRTLPVGGEDWKQGRLSNPRFITNATSPLVVVDSTKFATELTMKYAWLAIDNGKNERTGSGEDN
jgi:hypothetical protein